MPKITISAQLIRITRAVAPGQWLLIHPDEHYEVLDHEQAMLLQGKRRPPTKPTPVAPPAMVLRPVPNPEPRTRRTVRVMQIPKPASSFTIQVNGKTIHVEPQKMAVLQYMGAHGDLTVEQVGVLLDNPKTSILSHLKSLGFVTSKPVQADRFSPHVYSLTNEGRAIANGVPNA